MRAQAPRLARQRAARRASGDPQLRHVDLAMEIAPGGFRPRMPQRHQCASLILALAHLLDGNPVLSFGRNIKFLGRYLYGFLCICSLYCAEMFSATADYIDAPTGHRSQPPNYPMANNYDHDGETDSKDCIQKDGPSSAIAS